MIFNPTKKKSPRISVPHLENHHSRHGKQSHDEGNTQIGLSSTSDQNYRHIYRNIRTKQHIEKLGDWKAEITDRNRKIERFHTNISPTSIIPNNLKSFSASRRVSSLAFLSFYLPRFQQNLLPQSLTATFYALITLLLITQTYFVVPCNGEWKPLYLQEDNQGLQPDQQSQTFYEPNLTDDIISDYGSTDLNDGELVGQKYEEEQSSQAVGCLFSNDVCTQEEICFDDLILGRCISAADAEEVDEDENLYRSDPLSFDDQSLLDAEVERLLEQGFRWDDDYTQCILQTLINSFRFSGLEYDTTLCRAAFLPELSVERRVDVPKKFIIPNDDDINDNVEQTIADNKEIQEKPFYTSTKTRKSLPAAAAVAQKRSLSSDYDDSLSYLMPPTSSFAAANLDNDEFLNARPITNEYDDQSPVQLASYASSEPEDDNFLVGEEEDGGILIEPDQLSASTRVNQDQNPSSNDQEIEDDILPAFVMQPSADTSPSSQSLPYQMLFHPQDLQLAKLEKLRKKVSQNLQWSYNNRPYPYLEQQNPLEFHPPIWFDDVISPSSNYNFDNQEDNTDDDSAVYINYGGPELPTIEQNDGGGNEGIFFDDDTIQNINDNVNSDGLFADDYMYPLNTDDQRQPIISIDRRALGDYDDIELPLSTNDNEEKELMYLPVYSGDPNDEFLSRHKFATSKRSSVPSKNEEPQERIEEFKETFEYPVRVSVEGKEVPSAHYTRHAAEEPSGLREDIDVYEPEDGNSNAYIYEDAPNSKDEEDGEDEYDSGENELANLIFNRKGRLDVKKPGPFFPNSANNFFLNKVYGSEKQTTDTKTSPNTRKTKNAPEIFLGDPFGPRRSNYSADEKGQIEYEMPLQVLTPDPKKRFLAVSEPVAEKEYLHLMTKGRLNTYAEGEDLINMLADELGLPRTALSDPRIEDHHVQFRVDPNPQSIDAENMANRLENDIVLKKRISNQFDNEVAQAAAGNRDDYDVLKFPTPSLGNLLFVVLVSVSALGALIFSTAIFMLVRHCVRKRQNRTAMSKLETADVLESERGKVQEEYKQLCRDWSRSTNTKNVQPEQSPRAALVASENKPPQTSATTTTVKKLQGQDSKSDGSSRSSTSSWNEEPTSTNMDISTGHMVLAYMEDHLKNKQRLEQEWVALCGYEAEPCATTEAFKTENKKKNRYPDKLPYDHNRVILNAVLNGSNSDYINASSVTDHDPRNPSYIVSQGPLSQTVADFWQMIWEQGCVVIVMLSRLQDNGYQLCHRYWPEEGSEQYHIFEVHLVSEHVWCDDYLVRSVYLKNTRTGETRTVTQFHFRSWPAQSVPSSTKALLEFRRKVNKSYRGRSAPICVHCSDGVGRSGTYVLIDMVLNRMAKGAKEIDIAATLEHIRDQRSGMVQTKPQFEFCLMAVAEEVHAILKALLP